MQLTPPPLPQLRDDLRIESGAATLSGAPSWVIYDPVRHRYFQIGQRMIEVLRAWGGAGRGVTSQAQVQASVAQRFGWSPTDAEMQSILQFVTGSELTVTPATGGSRTYHQMSEKLNRKGPMALAKGYLFFRIPLVRPQRFLDATAGLARLLLSRGMVVILVLAALLGLGLVSRQWDAFISYGARFLSWEGAAYYAIALFFIKIVHELGHAWQARLRGVKVPVMGVAFMVLFPLLYTDVSDAWRCRKRRDRLMIDAGGVMMELGIAALATLAWVFLPDGPVRAVAFAAATASWVLSLLVNLNPFMRFDGYYFLSDAVGVNNLQPRAFALARWALRETLFDLRVPAPEPLSKGMRRFLITYACLTWVYRVVLYLGIALLVYNLFFKALGVLLMVVELTFFLALPVWREVQTWFQMRDRIAARPRYRGVGLGLALLVAALFVPFDSRVTMPATLGYAREAGLYPASKGLLTKVYVTEGQAVRAGDPLYELTSPELDRSVQAANRRLALAELRYARRGASREERGQGLVLAQELDAARGRVDGLSAAVQQMTVRAPFDGVVLDLDHSAIAGVWLSPRDRLGTLVAPDGLTASAYVPEDDVGRVQTGAEARFIPEDPARAEVAVRITSLSSYTATTLGRGYQAASQGGRIPVAPGAPDRPEAPFGAWFEVTATAPAQPVALTETAPVLRGVLVAEAAPQSIAHRALQQVARVLWRELGV